MPALLKGLTGAGVLNAELLINEIKTGSIWEDFLIRCVFGSESDMLKFADTVHLWVGKQPDGGYLCCGYYFYSIYLDGAPNCPNRSRDQIGNDVSSGFADLEAYGKMVLANLDFVERLKSNAPMNDADHNTFFGGDAQGYIDYPFLPASNHT